MAPTTANVRTALMEISTSRIPDSVITARLTWSTSIINAKKKSAAATADVDQAIIDLCAYDCYRRYVAQYTNAVSSTLDTDGFPGQFDSNDTNRLLDNLNSVLQSLKEAAEQSASLVLDDSLFMNKYTIIAPVAGLGRNMSYIDDLN